MCDMGGVNIKELADGVVFQVKVVPGSSRTAIAGQLDGMLKIKAAAPPEKAPGNATAATGSRNPRQHPELLSVSLRPPAGTLQPELQRTVH